jgi:hypothetical protein
VSQSRSTFERRRQAFGECAELYDRARPSYPCDAIVWMLGEQPLHVVDLGAGSATRSRPWSQMPRCVRGSSKRARE